MDQAEDLAEAMSAALALPRADWGDFFARMADPPGLTRDHGGDAKLLLSPWVNLYVRDGFKPKEIFSASQLDTWDGCQYAWGLRYLQGLRRPEPLWGPGLEPRDRSLAFGKALHARLESYFTGSTVDWTDEVGQRALIGLAYLPSQPPVVAEGAIDGQALARAALSLPELVLFQGYKDLDSPEILYDYKSTSSIQNWAKTPAQLIEDPAANEYALDDMLRLGLTARDCRWVYFASKGPPKAKPVDFTITFDGARRVVGSMMIRGGTLRQEIRQRPGRELDGLSRNLRTCAKYGGCVYHHSKGGPCDAERAPTHAQELIPASSLLGAINPDTSRKDPENMATLAERLAAANANPPPLPPPNPVMNSGAPPQGFAAPAPFQAAAPAGFGPPPAASPFPPAPAAAPPFTPPQAPPFAAAPAPFPPAAAPPVAAPVAPAQMNPPEAAAPFPPVPPPGVPMAQAPAAPNAAPPAKRGRKTNAQKAAELAAAGGVSPQAGAVAPTFDGDDLWTVTLKIARSDGAAFEVPASAEMADLVIAEVVKSAKAVIG